MARELTPCNTKNRAVIDWVAEVVRLCGPAQRSVGQGGIDQKAESRMGLQRKRLLLAALNVELLRISPAIDVDELAISEPDNCAIPLVGTRAGDEHAIAPVLDAQEMKRHQYIFWNGLIGVPGSGIAQIDEVGPIGGDVGREMVALFLLRTQLAEAGAVEVTVPDPPTAGAIGLPDDEATTQLLHLLPTVHPIGRSIQ